MSLLDDLINIDLSNLTEKVIAEYIWIGGSGMDMRSKSRILHTPATDDPHKLPKWNFDGSSTGQAAGKDSEIILYPQAIFKDPFRRDRNILVMCDAYTPTGDPIPTNKRYNADKIFSNPDVVAQQPWFGIDQQYTLLQKGTKWPIGLPAGVYPDPQGPFYCGVGSGKAFGRDIANAHYIACLYAGLNIGGISGEVAPGQWEFQVGPVTGVSAGDELWIARYILERITEITGVLVSFEPVLLHGDCYTSRTNVKYSTKSIREDEGYECIRKAIEKLGLRQETHLDVYGEGSEIANFENRGDSFRIGRGTEMAGKGYLEDWRAASNMDPYVVTSMIAETTIIWKAM